MFWLILLVVCFLGIDLFLGIRFFEYVYSAHIRHQPPLVQANKILRCAVINYINANYKNVKNICEIGSGFGTLARAMAKKTGATVWALENMPFAAFVSKFMDLFCRGHNKTIWCDAFDWMDNTNMVFDIAVAYLGPELTAKIPRYKNKIHVLISIDFEIKNMKPRHIIDMGRGATIYMGKKYPHRIFIYELNHK